MVYGALANNPIPLTEAAVLRPDPTFVYARQLAAAEETIDRWRVAAPDRTVAMLRPVVPIAADGTSSLARALTAGYGQPFGEADPDAQFVHHDDVASAVALAVVDRLDDVYNVAPDGSIPGERVRALTGQRFRLPMPSRVADVVGPVAMAVPAGPDPARSAFVHPGAVGRRQRQVAGRRLGADRHQRAGVRRGHRGEVVDDGDAEASSGVVARRHDRRCGGRRRWRSGSWDDAGGVVERFTDLDQPDVASNR